MGRERWPSLLDDINATDPEDEDAKEPEKVVKHCICGASDEYPDDDTLYACTSCRQPLVQP